MAVFFFKADNHHHSDKCSRETDQRKIKDIWPQNIFILFLYSVMQHVNILLMGFISFFICRLPEGLVQLNLDGHK